MRAADPAIEQILLRLEKLEAENIALRDEVKRLRDRLEPGTGPPIEERVAVHEQRIEEQQQTKVESSERVPVKFTGTILFNAFSAGRNGGPAEFPTVATQGRGPRQIRGTMQQTSFGFEVESPSPVFGAHARGHVLMDFYAEYEDYFVPRIRVASMELNWKNQTLRAGIEKPIVAPRNPVSLAQVVYPALWGAGNLWLWEPMASIEQRFHAGETEFRAQAGIFQTDDARVGGQAGFAPTNLQPRPGWQGRFQIGRRWDDQRAIEIAPGFHYSRTLVASTSAPSQLATADWLFGPSKWWEISGAMFHGRNAAPVGGLRQGVIVLAPGNVRAVRTTGGWTQLLLRPLPRLRLHAMAGQQNDNDRDLPQGGIGRNLSWALNGIVQLSPNVLLGLELQQIRTTYIGSGTRVLNRYDVALAYTF
jgi:hypothetical protein